MDTNMTFRMDADVKAQMAAICSQLGMTTSTAFNIFANAFVRMKGMPFPVAIQEPVQSVSRATMRIRYSRTSQQTMRRWLNDMDNR